ncbi:pentapeptide repeat-containing protein [Nonomuraea dietziae]|uniref:pentapeptide repeat-containing protein n=1 Tax=Nonomuraea dietziae TaxID=65515 RepID=UPI00340848D1
MKTYDPWRPAAPKIHGSENHSSGNPGSENHSSGNPGSENHSSGNPGSGNPGSDNRDSEIHGSENRGWEIRGSEDPADLRPQRADAGAKTLPVPRRHAPSPP